MTQRRKNEFSLKFVGIASKGRLNQSINQFKLIFQRNVSLWYYFRPTLFHGSLLIDFFSMGFNQPTYISVIREPLKRFVSHYYFKRHNNNPFSEKLRIYHGDNRTFADCVKQNNAECHLERLWLQIPHFVLMKIIVGYLVIKKH